MSQQSRLAVEVTKGEDFLNIWVDANNNGVRDDDDVNIFVTKSGGFFAESPTFKDALDAHLKQKLQEASIALIEAGHDPVAEEAICDLAFELVVKACTTTQASVAAQEAAYVAQEAVPQPEAQWQPQSQAEQLYAQWATQPTAQAASSEYTEHGIPIYRPQA